MQSAGAGEAAAEAVLVVVVVVVVVLLVLLLLSEVVAKGAGTVRKGEKERVHQVHWQSR